MATADGLTGRQLDYIMNMAATIIPDYMDVEDLNQLVEPVYGCKVHEMNRGQAGMLIDDLRWEMRAPGVVEPDFQSIFE